MPKTHPLRRHWPVAVVSTSLLAGFATFTATTSSVWGRGFLHHASLPPLGFAGFPSPTVQTVYAAFTAPYPQSDAPRPVVLGQHTLLFHGDDADEAENVSLCVQQLDGVVIPPNAVFSYNDTVGERTEERGFRPGLMYVSGSLVSTIGGGVCIPATAVYNAALLSDMEIVERYNHSGPVHYADPGRDAAVAFGVKDLRFRNNSGHPVMIRAAAMGDRLTVALVGVAVPGRRVVVDRVGYTPAAALEKRVDDPSVPPGTRTVKHEGRAGYAVSVVRTVFQNGREMGRETISHDVVAPLPRVVLLNPLDDPASPEAVAAKKKADALVTNTAKKKAAVPPAEVKAAAGTVPEASNPPDISVPVEWAAPQQAAPKRGEAATPPAPHVINVLPTAKPDTSKLSPAAKAAPTPTPTAPEATVGSRTRGM